jgi:hypothetical protein
MRKLIFIKLVFTMIAGVFIFAAGAAENVSAQKSLPCPNTRCGAMIRGTCPRQLKFFCAKVIEDGNNGCFNRACTDLQGIVAERATTVKVRPGSFVSEDGIKVKNKVNIPLTAVFVINDKSFWVYVMKGGNVLKRPVKIGKAGADSIEIISGLKSGDTIIRNPIVIARRTGKEVTDSQ